MGQLTELQIKAAAPRDKEYLLADGDALYLYVRPTGKAWVYSNKRYGKEAKLSIGHYPVVTLAAARRKARAAAEKRADGPQEARRIEEARDRVARLNTFERTARAWHAVARKDGEWSAGKPLTVRMVRGLGRSLSEALGQGPYTIRLHSQPTGEDQTGI